jgi:hypothetical protein
MHYAEWRPESQFTAIAWSWVGDDRVSCIVLEQDLNNERWMLEEFLRAYNHADIVTGHYIRKHDLPMLTDHCIRARMALPKSVLTQDTMDIAKVKGLGKSQENLSTEFKVSAGKHHMNGSLWREANTLSPEGQATARKRVIDDVLQHKQLRVELLERGLLKPPKRWAP